MQKRNRPSSSFRFRTVLMVNAVVAGMLIVFGYIAGTVAGRILEEQTRSTNGSRYLPFFSKAAIWQSTTPCCDIWKQLFMVHFAAVDPRLKQSGCLQPTADTIGRIRIAPQETRENKDHHLGRHPIRTRILPNRTSGRYGKTSRFFAISDASRLDTARTRVMRQIMLATLPAILVATLLSLLLAQALTRPIARLATAMDRIATEKNTFSGTSFHSPKSMPRVKSFAWLIHSTVL